MSTVAIVKGTSPVETTVKALETIGSHADSALSGKKPILIKPNYINSKHPSTGITTDSRVIEGIVKFLRERKIEDIIIGEGSGLADTFEAFKVAGVDAVAERWGAKLVDLNKDEFVEVNPPNLLSLRKVRVAKTALESTIISVPKLKPHRVATVTLSLKNMMGALASKGSMHTGSLSENIVDLASIIKPSISVVDGIIAGEGHETSGNPIEMNIVIAGTDPVAVDAVGAAVMGISPTDVKHLLLAEKRGLGTCNLQQIIVLGETIEKVKRKFHRSFHLDLFTSDKKSKYGALAEFHLASPCLLINLTRSTLFRCSSPVTISALYAFAAATTIESAIPKFKARLMSAALRIWNSSIQRFCEGHLSISS